MLTLHISQLETGEFSKIFYFGSNHIVVGVNSQGKRFEFQLNLFAP